MYDVNDITRTLGELLESPDQARRAKLINAIARESLPGKLRLLGNQVIAVGLGIDRWTVDGVPAGVVFVNDDEQEMVWQLELGCQAGPEDLPLVVTVDDGVQRLEIEVTSPGSRRVDLPPVPSKAERLVIVSTDKTWSPGTHDRRRLGVNVDVTPTGTLEALLEKPDADKRAKLRDEIAREAFAGKMRLLGNGIVAAGLSLDHWTQDGVPVALVFTNYDDREVSPQLVFACHAGVDELPVNVIIEDGQRQREYLFEQPESRQITLSPVSPHTKRLYIVTADKTWSPGPGDPRRLGVGINISPAWTLRCLQQRPDAYIRVKLAEVIANEAFEDKQRLLDDFIVAVGLTGDHWTHGGEAAALVVTNTLDQAVVPGLTLGCNASPDELPITATVDDGQQAQQYTITEAGQLSVDLSPVPHHSRRLYIVTTDGSWSPGGGDERQLGVSLDVSPLGILKALSDEADAKVWGKLAAAIADPAALPQHRVELLQGQVAAVGLSPDGWTQGSDPAGVAISNASDHEAVWELELSCHASQQELPITATVHDGQQRALVRFDQPGSQQVVLSPVPAGAEALYLISCDGTWSPGQGDDRRLGVNVAAPKISLPGTLRSLLGQQHQQTRQQATDCILEQQDLPRRQVLEDPRVTASGLTGDQWTEGDTPAGVVLVNADGERDLVLDLGLVCHAAPEDLPITAVVEDGHQAHEVRFHEAGSRLFTLAPVPAGEARLFIITTDRTWSPGTESDQRQLGVRVTVEG